MLWCCDPLEPVRAEEEPTQSKEASYSFPDGQRRFVKTGGNALAAAPPPSQAPSGSQDLERVSVVVQPGTRPGQIVMVHSPDGSRTVTAQVPHSVQPGDSFVVEFPPAQSARQQLDSTPSFANALDTMLTPTPEAVATAIEEPMPPAKQPIHIESMSSAESRQEMEGVSKGQKLLLVQVPHGVAAGSTIHVEIPGEGRTLAAEVPPNCSSFHVSYTPHPIHKPINEAPRVFPPEQAHSTVVSRAQPNGQKLILVRTPPGALPGTTLHVSVPDEPGRILAVQVPPGNVSEFHVAYEARQEEVRRSMLPPANAYAQGGTSPSYQQQTSVYGQHQPQGQQKQYRGMSPQQHGRDNGDGMGSFIMPLVGGAALGAAGMATYDHFHNNTTGAGDYDATYGDAGGGYDYGDAGDYGGDYDTGGFDFF